VPFNAASTAVLDVSAVTVAVVISSTGSAPTAVPVVAVAVGAVPKAPVPVAILVPTASPSILATSAVVVRDVGSVIAALTNARWPAARPAELSL
jgi:hypothetical protein